MLHLLAKDRYVGTHVWRKGGVSVTPSQGEMLNLLLNVSRCC